MSRQSDWQWKLYSYTSWVLLLNSTMDLSLKISKMLNLPENVVKKVLEVKEQHPKQNYEYLASKVSKELDYILQAEDVKEIVQKARELVKDVYNNDKKAISLLNEWEEIKPRYFEDWYYKIPYKSHSKDWPQNDIIKLSLKLADDMHKDYSSKGNNLSSDEMRQKYDLKGRAWNAIKRAFWMLKSCHILSPLSMDIASQNWTIQNVIEVAVKENFQDKYLHIYKNAHVTNLEKEVKRLAKAYWTRQWFLEQLQPIVNSIKPIKFEVLKHKVYKWVTPVYHFGDTHIGKRETEKVIARMDAMANDIIKEPSKDIVINCWWDIFETLVAGGMHTGQVEWMDWIYNFELFMYSVNVYVNFLTKILKSGKNVKFVWIGWNHDRPVEINDKSPERTYALIFYTLLEAKLSQSNIEFQIIQDRVGKFNVDWIDYITTHEPLHSKQPEKMGWKYGDTDKHTIYVHFDRHTEATYTGRNVTQLWVNAMAWSNDYDTKMWLHWYTGYTKTRKNEFWLPDYLSKRLP